MIRNVAWVVLTGLFVCLIWKGSDRFANAQGPIYAATSKDGIYVVKTPTDTTAPVVTITTPGANAFTNSATITVTGTATDDQQGSGISSVAVNNVPATYDVNTHVFTANVGATGPGLNTITAIATDLAGNNSAPATATITVDFFPPVLTINSPAEGSTTDSTITVTGTVTDSGSGIAKVTVNQATATLNGNTYSATLQNFCDQPQVITAVAFDKANNIAIAKRNVTVIATSPSACWNRIGPEGGVIVAVATDPTDSKIVYAGSTNGQVFKSVDAGANWVSASVGLPGLSVNSLLITRNSPVTIYAGISRQVYRSLDGGNSWQPSSSGLPNTTVRALNSDPSNPGVLYASTFNALFKSINAGTDWFLVNDGITGKPNSVTVDPTNSNVVYACTADGVFKSTDAGLTWQARNSGLPTSSPSIFSVVIDPTNPNLIYASGNGIFKSTNGGANWTSASNGLPSSGFTFPLILRIDPASSTTLYFVTSSGLFKSTDSAGSWSGTSSGLPQAGVFFDFAFDVAVPHAFYLATNTGIYKSIDGEQSWNFTNHGLVGNLVRSVSIDPTDSKILYVTTDDATLKSIDGGLTWQQLPTTEFGGLTQGFVFDPFDHNTLYAGTIFHVAKSTDGGTTWSHLFDSGANIIRLDPSNPGTIYAAGNSGFFKSTNGGQNWKALVKAPFFGFGFITSIVVDPSNSNIIYVADESGISKSVNGGSSWAATNNGLTFSITSLIMDIANPQILYAAFNHGLFKTTDGGADWTLLSGEISNSSSVTSLIQDPDNPSIIYAAAPDGIFKSTDGGIRWATIMNGLSLFPLSPLVIDPNNPTALYVGTDTGVFSLQQPADPNELVPAITNLSQTSAATAGPSFNLTITGSNFVTGSKVLWNGSPRFTVFNSDTQLTATIAATDIATPGISTITVANPGSHNSNPQTFTVGKIDQTITFGALPNRTFGSGSFTVNATSTSGLPVSFTVVSGPVSVSGNTVTMLGAGTVVLEAHQDGNAAVNAATPVDQSFVINNPLPQIFKLSPGAIIAGSGPTTVKILGGFYVADTLVKVDGIDHAATYVNPIEMDMVLSPAEIATPGTKTIRVFNSAPGGGTSIPVTLKIISITSSDSKNIQPGTTDTVSNAPVQSGDAGITAQLNHSQSAGGPATVTVEQYSTDPLGGSGLIDVGGGYVDLKVTGADPNDVLNATFYYGSNVTGTNEDKLQLLYFTGSKWAKVRSSGNTDPIKNTSDNQNGTVSGGSFTVVFDETSSPKLSQLTGTIFSSTPGLYGDLNSDTVVNVVDLILMANFLAGNTTVDKTAGDLTLDGKLNVSDLIALANFLAGNVAHLPASSSP